MSEGDWIDLKIGRNHADLKLNLVCLLIKGEKNEHISSIKVSH